MLLILSTALLHTRWFSLAKIFLSLQAIFIVFICFIPLGTIGLYGLENRIPNKIFSEIDGINGVIVLGGAENPQLTTDTGKINLNHNSERLIYAGFFAKKKVKVLFLGGSGSINQELLKETSVVKKYFEKIDKKTYILYDNRPRNTYEAAKYATEYKMLKQGKWVLITSAFHMPRAIACFDKYELDLIPFSVDHRIYKRALLSNPVEELNYISIVIHEYIGMLYYFLKGRI